MSVTVVIGTQGVADANLGPTDRRRLVPAGRRGHWRRLGPAERDAMIRRIRRAYADVVVAAAARRSGFDLTCADAYTDGQRRFTDRFAVVVGVADPDVARRVRRIAHDALAEVAHDVWDEATAIACYDRAAGIIPAR